ncbi:MAG TPA: hypothetical protein VLC29_02730, partial [Rhizomicrobium sp.]|nr:hypothetical protein [Rhizomicrobium sp.]
GRGIADFSFSGLKTAVRQIAKGEDFKDSDRADLAASFQRAVLDILMDRSRIAMDMFRKDFPNETTPDFVVAGGVAANRAIGDAIQKLCDENGFCKKIPPPGLCTDNAAMVAWAGVERSQLGLFDSLGVGPKARWPLSGSSQGGEPDREDTGKGLAG